MPLRSSLFAIFIVLISFRSDAQMLGNLNDYPSLHISMHYTPPDGASNEGMQIEWTAPSQPQEQLKVHATVTSLKKESVEGDIPASTIAPVFTQARLMTGSIRLKAAEEKPPVSNEHFSVDISHSLHEVSLEFTVRRTDATAWRAAVVFWNYLRGIMPASVREFVAERH